MYLSFLENLSKTIFIRSEQKFGRYSVYLLLNAILTLPLLSVLMYNYVFHTLNPALIVLFFVTLLFNALIADTIISFLIRINTYHQRENIYFESVGDGIFAI